MNNIVINKKILEEIYDDQSFKNEISELLNSLIDEEMEKENPNFDLIDECVSALIEIQSGIYSTAIPFIAKNKFRNEEKKRKILSIFFACAVIFSLSFGVMAINHTIEKRKEEEKTTTQVTTEDNTFSTTVNATEQQTTERSVIAQPISLNLSFSDTFKSEYKSASDFSLNGITVKVKYSDGTEKNIDINNCKIIKNDNFGIDSVVEKVTVEYEGLTDSFYVTFSGNVHGFTTEQYTLFSDDIENPKITASTSYVEIGVGESISIPMKKSKEGFVKYTTDNNLLENISMGYPGGVNGKQISLNITAGNQPGMTKISFAFVGNSDSILETITVNIVEQEKNSELNDNDQ